MNDENKLIVSHLLTKFGDQVWTFLIPLVLVYVFPATIFPGSFFSFGVQLVQIIVNPMLGKWMDDAPRWKVVQIGILGQCVSVLLITLLMMVVLFQYVVLGSFYQVVVFSATLAVLAIPGECCAMMLGVAIERDWVPTLFPTSLT